MTTDSPVDVKALVERLRNLNPWNEMDWPEVCREAADALEALQSENARMREALEKIADVSEFRDGVGLCQFRPAMTAELAQETAYQARAALSAPDVTRKGGTV